MQTKNGFVWFPFLISLLVLGVSVVAGGAVYLLAAHYISPEPAPVVETPQEQPTSDLKTYTNSQYGFSIQYPKDMTVSEKPSQLVNFMSLKQGTLVLIIGSESDGVVVAISSDADDVANCVATPAANPENSATNVETVSINGRNFLHISTGDVGLGQFFNAQIYKTLHNNMCVEVSGRYTGASVSHYSGAEAEQVAAGNQAKAAKMDAIVKSFKFTPISKISATPTFGTAPLVVTFTVGFMGLGEFWVEFGDGEKVEARCAEWRPGTDACVKMKTLSHTYTAAGNYTVSYKEKTFGTEESWYNTISTVTISVR